MSDDIRERFRPARDDRGFVGRGPPYRCDYCRMTFPRYILETTKNGRRAIHRDSLGWHLITEESCILARAKERRDYFDAIEGEWDEPEYGP